MDNLKKLYNYLKKQKNKKILFLTTSNRWEGDKELPKSSIIADELIKIQNDYIVNNANPTLTNMYNDFLNETDAANKKIKVDALVSYYNNTYAPLFTQGIDSGFDADGKSRGPNGLKKGDIRSKNAESLFKILGGNYPSKYITYTSVLFLNSGAL
jgi:hypothetical protein